MQKTSKQNKKNKEELPTCPICMQRKVNCKPDQCIHQFCYRCLKKWGRRRGNCPLCRRKVRRIHYKKTAIEPQYLKVFDEVSSSQEPILQPQRIHRQEILPQNFASRNQSIVRRPPPVYILPVLRVTFAPSIFYYPLQGSPITFFNQ